MHFEQTNIYPHMDPRLQYALDRHDRGVRVRPPAGPGGPDEIGVIALVSDVAAWHERGDVRDPVTIGRTDRGWIVTATVPIARIEPIRRAEVVISLKAAQPLRPMLASTVPEINAAAALPPDLLTSAGEGAVVGVVDSGLSIVHRNFRRPDGSTRIVALWDQTAASGPGSPAGYGYGRRYGAAEINAALRAADPHLALLGYGPRPAESGGHGTHVTDIAAGNGRGSRVPGVAPMPP